MLEILQNNQQITSENTEEITIQDKTFQLFETTNLTIGFEVNKMNKKSIIDPDCCTVISDIDIFISSDCTCSNTMKLQANSISFTWSQGDPPIILTAPSIEIDSTGNDFDLFLLQYLRFESNTLLATSKGVISIGDASFSVSTITMNGTRVVSSNIYSSEVSSLTLIGFSNGVRFCGNVASSTNLNLIGTSNSIFLDGVQLCINDDQSTTMIMKNLYIEGNSNTKAGVSIEKRFVCTENACDITGKSIDDYGVYLYTSEISNAKITGTSEQSNGIKFLCRTTNTGNHFYEEIELIGSGIIGVEINILDQTFIDNLIITGTSLSNTDGIKIDPNFRQLQTTGSFESINGSIKLPKWLNISSEIYPDLLELNSDNEIFFDCFVNDQISIYLGSNGILDIINGYLSTASKLVVYGLGQFGLFGQSRIYIPNGGAIAGDAIFQLDGSTIIGNGLEVNGALQWTTQKPLTTGILCGDFVVTQSIALPLNTITRCSIGNQLNIKANTDTITIYKLDGSQNLINPSVLISANNINLENKVNHF